MGVNTYKDLMKHKGHRIVLAIYGKNDENIAIECETCNEIILDFNKYETK